jgi:hemin uptake protein HemP
MKNPSTPGALTGHSALPEIAATRQSPRRQIRSAELFSGQREVLIEHAGEVYSLRQTSKGKLILTK